jgi:hypothetical protein
MQNWIYNFVQLLRNQFPNERFYPDEQYRLLAESQVPDRRCIIQETAGTPEHIIDISGAEIKCRDIDPYNAKDFCYDVYNFLHGTKGLKGKFGVELPEVTIGATTYPAIKTSQISAVQTPSYLETDKNKRSEYIFNIQIYI